MSSRIQNTTQTNKTPTTDRKTTCKFNSREWTTRLFRSERIPCPRNVQRNKTDYYIDHRCEILLDKRTGWKRVSDGTYIDKKETRYQSYV